MSKVSRKQFGPGWVTVLVALGLIELAIVIKYLLIGKNVALFNPQGWVAEQQYDLLVLTLILLLAGAVPVILLLYFVAWKYRESNTKAAHKPEARQTKHFVFTMWAYPTLFFFIFLAILIPATHKLEPRKLIRSDTKPLNIQVVSMRWKWLFIYPEQGVASVNYVKIPKDTPVTFHLTADEAPMSSFWVPNLGGQLYSMTGHVNRLNLLATEVGDYPGRSAEINGDGFSGMTFTASVSNQAEFNQWVRNTKQASATLNARVYNELVKPSESVKPVMYAKYDSDLYAKVLMKYSGTHGSHEPQKTEQSQHEGH